MNILHARYALEVAKSGSISKASEKLFVAVPNISRSIKELERDLGISIFARYPKGVKLTREGEIFISYAKDVLNQIDYIDAVYKENASQKQRFSISVPYAYYISEAFSAFSGVTSNANWELIYKENDAASTIKSVFDYDFHLGIIRYSKEYDNFYKKQLEEKNLRYEVITEFSPVILANKGFPLAKNKEVRLEDLKDYTEIIHSDISSLTHPFSQKNKKDSSGSSILVFDGAMQYSILQKNTTAYICTSPVSKEFLKKHDLVQIKLVPCINTFKDLLIYRKGYKLTSTDSEFITALCETKRAHFPSMNE